MTTVLDPIPTPVRAPRRATLARLTLLEARKSLSTRSGVALSAAAAVLPAGMLGLMLALDDPPPNAAVALALLGTLVSMLLLAVGILSTAGEWTHGTVQTTFLAEPRRGRVVAAKYAAAALLGAALVAVVVASTLAVAAAFTGPDFSWDGIGVAVVAVIAGGAVLTATGAGIGAAVGNSPAALTGTYITLLIGMSVLNGVKPAWGRRVDPLTALFDLIDGAAAARPAGVLAGWLVVSTMAGAVVTRRRQLT